MTDLKKLAGNENKIKSMIAVIEDVGYVCGKSDQLRDLDSFRIKSTNAYPSSQSTSLKSISGSPTSTTAMWSGLPKPLCRSVLPRRGGRRHQGADQAHRAQPRRWAWSHERHAPWRSLNQPRKGATGSGKKNTYIPHRGLSVEVVVGQDFNLCPSGYMFGTGSINNYRSDRFTSMHEIKSSVDVI